MPVFVAIGEYVAVSILGLAGTAATIVGGIVAVGAAFVTSRIINGNPNKGNNSATASQGGRIQIPPATNNKIPVVYGSAYVNGIITDARLISTDQKINNTMYYCIVLSETAHTGTPTYTVNDIYWNDLRLTFDSTSPYKVKDGRKTVDGPGEDFIDTNFVQSGNNLVEVRVYAGGSAAANQIFPTTNTTPAYTYWAGNDGSWDSTYQMKGLVYAIVKVTWNQDKGFTGLPNMTFQLANSISNPADVWYDYMTSQRYGAGIDPSYIDTSANTIWKNFSDEDITYTDKDGVTNQLTERYTINGVIDTSQPVKTNIDTILQSGGAWMSYNVATGLWSPVIKKAITAGEQGLSSTYFTASRSGSTLTVTNFPAGRIEAGQRLYNAAGSYIGNVTAQILPLTAGETTGQKGRYTISTSGSISSTTFFTLPASILEFTDSNIISGITISSTRLEDLYNMYEVEFYDKHNKDQKAYARASIASGERNPNEPDNQLRMSLDLANNSVQADLLGNLELRQSRDDLVIEFTSNFYGIQAQAGDVISVTSDLYDWNPKLFRVMRVKEQETEDGGLVAQIQALEYNPDVYTVEAITEFTTSANIGIGVFGADPNLPPPSAVIINQVDADVAIPNFQLNVTIPSTGGPFDEIELYYTEGWDEFSITGSIVPGTGSNGAPVGDGLLTVTAATYGSINVGDYFTVSSTTFTITSQLTSNPASKTFASGGTPSQTLVTLNNVTGLKVGHTLTGTGITSGAHILEIDTGTNTVRLDTGFTAQAAGTYVVTGGLGTYVVDTSATLSGTTLLYDQPVDTDYLYLKKVVPEGNQPTFINGQVVTIVVTEVPANSATYRRWYIKARLGVKKRFGKFSTPTNTDYTGGRFPYRPSPVGGGALTDLSDVNITSAAEGDIFYYDATTSKWRNTPILGVKDGDPAGIYIDVNSTAISRFNLNSNLTDYSTAPLVLRHTSTGIPIVGFGTALGFEAEVGASNAVKTIGFIDYRMNNATYGSEDFHFGLGVMKNGVECSTITPNYVLDISSNGDLTLNGTGQFITFSTQPQGVNTMYGIRGMSALDDPWFVGSGSVGTDQGYLEIATGDNSNGSNSGGQIYVRQYNGQGAGGAPWYGGSGTVQNELILLNNVGYTSIPKRLGINTTSPQTTLDVRGGVYAETANSNERPVFQYNNSDAGTNSGVFLRKNYGTSSYTTGDGAGVAFQIDSDSQVANQIAIVDATYDATASPNKLSAIRLRTNTVDNTNGPFTTTASFTSALATLNGDLQINGNDIKSSTGASAITLSGADVIANGGLDVDAGTLHVDPTNNRVGIKNSSPVYDLDVNGTTNIETSLTVPSISTLTGDDLNISAFSGKNINITATNGADSGGLTLTSATSTDPVTLVRTTTNTNSSARAVTLRHKTSATPAIGIGTQLEFETQTATSGTIVAGGYIENQSTSITAGSESFKFRFLLRDNGTTQERMVLDSAGNLQFDGALTATGGFTGLNVDSGTLYVDTINNRVGVNTTSPAEALHVIGNIKTNGALKFQSSTDPAKLTWNETDRLFEFSNNVQFTSIDAYDTTWAHKNLYIGDSSASAPTGIFRQFGNNGSMVYDPATIDNQVIVNQYGGTTIQTIDSWDMTIYRSAKYLIQVDRSGESQLAEIFVTHDGTNISSSIGPNINTGSALTTLSVDTSGGLVRIRSTNAALGATYFTIERKLISLVNRA